MHIRRTLPLRLTFFFSIFNASHAQENSTIYSETLCELAENDVHIRTKTQQEHSAQSVSHRKYALTFSPDPAF